MFDHATTWKSSGVGAGAARGGGACRSGCEAVGDRGGAGPQRAYRESVVGQGPQGGNRRGRRHAPSGSRAEALGPASAVAAAAVAQRGSGPRLVDRLVDRAAGPATDRAEVRPHVSCELRSHAAQVAGLDAAKARTPSPRAGRRRDRTLGACRLAADQKKSDG